MTKSENRGQETGRKGRFRFAHVELCYFRRSELLVLGLLTGVVWAAGLSIETTSKTPLLRDGYILRDVDGTLMRSDGNDVWFFELNADVNDSISVVEAGTRLELLPSSVLERTVADAKMRSVTTYLLRSGRVTKYKGRNFIFPNSFLPLIEPDRHPTARPKKPPVEEPPEPESGHEMALDEPNDVLGMPPEIAEKLGARRQEKAVPGQRIADSNITSIDALQKAIEDVNTSGVIPYIGSTDSILVDRTAFLVRQSHDRLVFSMDALGRNIRQMSLCLLPCEALELAEQEQAAEPERVRFRIAGIVTKYKDDNYLLLHRATRAYNQGNFGR